MARTFDELKTILRPEGVVRGEMAFDPEKCVSCGQCIDNCVFRCLEMGPDGAPRMKQEQGCFSCFNCLATCPSDAVSIVRAYHVEGGFYDTGEPALLPPREPKDAQGQPAQWTEVERTILRRRSVRNFKPDPVPEPLIERVLEAGRFAPSAGNNQPWRFVVVTDPVLLQQMEGACQAVFAGMHEAYADDAKVMGLVEMMGEPVPVGFFDPRVQVGVGCVARRELRSFLGAPCAIFVLSCDKMVGPEMQAGICLENMNLAACSLGLGFCWSGFASGIANVPEFAARLGIAEPWRLVMTGVMGYPAFSQEGLVPRHDRPVTWFRPQSS
ncbi:MAG: nitroreductase family protein [Deltaproteobacteria bacterium]|nr:nitroreductase family protein [Deltaproteobacteria bacterium]